MKRLLWLVLTAGMLTGCGPALLGAWSGNLAVAAACSDGSGFDDADAVTWTISRGTGGRLNMSTGVLCGGSVWLTDYGDHASIDSQVCPPVVISGALVTPVVTAGSIDLVDASPPFIDVAAQARFDLPPSTTCVAHYLAALVAR